MEHILKYFPELSEKQRLQMEQLETLYPEWNAKINVISRKDIDNLEINHILHSLGLVKFVQFTPGTRVMDLGTGGGFPAIPLAIYYPEVTFHLVDRIGKKLRVASDIAERIGLTNVTFQHGDVKEVKGKFDFVVSRAVMDLGDMVPLVKRFIDSEDRNAVPNGLLCLKGGDLTAEVQKFKNQVLIDDLSHYFKEDFFKTKKILYLPLEPLTSNL
ncbi:MAG: 16S rRNA (guanine(527)-N(7))-methyltransferase RsmG [Muribaculaceae bacterium]|nr:16S rRNA (guanine(527)-N(7))-methyltransferase RsmG [Muribaculaceae bacterium]